MTLDARICTAAACCSFTLALAAGCAEEPRASLGRCDPDAQIAVLELEWTVAAEGPEGEAANADESAGSAEGEDAGEVTRSGEVALCFYSNVAPDTVENFVKLIRQGFYDGTRIHRISPGFVIQGGDPNSRDEDLLNDGFGGPGYTIADEFSDTPHRRGTVSMASPGRPDSAGSQFFIVLADRAENGQPWTGALDGRYTAFAEVIRGMEVVDAIAALPRISDYPPLADNPALAEYPLNPPTLTRAELRPPSS